jgi:hypothetical protein
MMGWLTILCLARSRESWFELVVLLLALLILLCLQLLHHPASWRIRYFLKALLPFIIRQSGSGSHPSSGRHWLFKFCPQRVIVSTLWLDDSKPLVDWNLRINIHQQRRRLLSSWDHKLVAC